jgi:hypothetical protein
MAVPLGSEALSRAVIPNPLSGPQPVLADFETRPMRPLKLG